MTPGQLRAALEAWRTGNRAALLALTRRELQLVIRNDMDRYIGLSMDFIIGDEPQKHNWRRTKRNYKRLSGWLNRNGSNKSLRTMESVLCIPKRIRKPWRRNQPR